MIDKDLEMDDWDLEELLEEMGMTWEDFNGSPQELIRTARELGII